MMPKLLAGTLSTMARAVRAHWLGLMLIASILGPIMAVILINPLPSDEELIEHFRQHRADITEIVRRFRSFEPPPDRRHDLYLWQQQGDTPELMRRAGLWTVDYGLGLWYTDPYSMESAAKVNQLSKSLGFLAFQKYGAVFIRPLEPAYRRLLPRYYLRRGFKDLVYFPEPPRIEGGRLLMPRDHMGIHGSTRVLDSLTAYPPDWRKGECVLRQIEPQWFIRMCNV